MHCDTELRVCQTSFAEFGKLTEPTFHGRFSSRRKSVQLLHHSTLSSAQARQRKALRQAEEDRRQAEEAKRLRKAERRAKFAEQQALAPPDRDDHKIASLDPLSKVSSPS
jgi:hypothetical protein